MKATELRDNQLHHALGCPDCVVTDQGDVRLCGRGAQLGDNKQVLREEISRRARENRRND